MENIKRKIRFVGVLIIISMIAGIFSVAPAIDSSEYLIEAASNSFQVTIGAIFQLIMSFAYLGIGILLYPIVKRFNENLANGFLSFRIIAVTLVIMGTILLLSILTLSQEFANNSHQNIAFFEVMGNVLKITRDYINHVFMILVLCIGNILLYMIFIQSKLIPRWISICGIIGSFLSVVASVLVLFQVVDIITTQYIILNVPTAIIEFILAIWLIVKGFDKRILLSSK